jgi:hypothetical protein
MKRKHFLNTILMRSSSVFVVSLFCVVACSPSSEPGTAVRNAPPKGSKETPPSKSGADGSTGEAVIPVLESVPSVHVRAGESFDVVVNARDSENNPLRYSLACPAELGGVVENDNGRFTRPVGRNVSTQTTRCGVMVRNKYPNKTPPVQYFEVNITGVPDGSRVSSGSSGAYNPQSGAAAENRSLGGFNPALVLGALAKLATDSKIFSGGKGGSKPQTEAKGGSQSQPEWSYADTWSKTPAGFDGFAFDKQLVDSSFKLPADTDLSKAWGGTAIDAYKYDKIFSGTDLGVLNSDSWKESLFAPATFDTKNSSWSSGSDTSSYWNTDVDLGIKFDGSSIDDYSKAFANPETTIDWKAGFEKK